MAKASPTHERGLKDGAASFSSFFEDDNERNETREIITHAPIGAIELFKSLRSVLSFALFCTRWRLRPSNTRPEGEGA